LITEVRTVADRKVLFQRVEFATDANPIAKDCLQSLPRKISECVSVGFHSDAMGKWRPGHLCSGVIQNRNCWRFRAVGIPANPNALALGLKAGALSKTTDSRFGSVAPYALRPRQARLSRSVRVTAKYLRLLKLARASRVVERSNKELTE